MTREVQLTREGARWECEGQDSKCTLGKTCFFFLETKLLIYLDANGIVRRK